MVPIFVKIIILTGLAVSSSDSAPYCPSVCTCYNGPYVDFMFTSMTEVMQEAHFGDRWNKSESYVERKKKLLTKPYLDATVNQIRRWKGILSNANLTSNVTHMDCNITQDFNLGMHKRFLRILSNRDVSMILRCTTKERGPVMWPYGSFMFISILASLRIENCDIHPENENRMIPASANLYGLEFVNVNSDFLENLQFSNNSNLMSLQLSYNNLWRVPDGFTHRAFPNLLWLALNNNNLGKDTLNVCDFISGTPLLMELYIQNNQLTQIPECLCGYKNLWLMPSYGNLISSFGRFSCFEDMIAIDARHNVITALSGYQFKNLKLIQEVNLGYNRIAHIESGTFSELPYLTKIILSDNQIGFFDTSMIMTYPFGLPKITLDLSHNNLSFLPFYDVDTPELGPNFQRDVTIYLKGNTFYCGCGLNILKMFMQNPTITSDIENATCFEPLDFRNSKLIDIDISVSCRVTKWCPRMCKCTRYVKSNEISIDCAGQRLQDVPNAIPKGKISKLDLHNNSLVTFVNQSYLSRVQSLDASQNKLDSIAVDLFWHSRKLNLSFNQLESLPQSLRNFDLPDGMRVDLRKNPLNCSEQNIWIKEWIKNNSDHFVAPSTLCKPEARTKMMPTTTPKMMPVTDNIALEIGLILLFGIIFILITLLVCFRKKLRSVCGYYGMRRKTRSSFRAGFPPLKVLLVCSDRDSEWAFEHLVLPLEGHHPPYTTFLKSRDKAPGTPVQAAYDNWLEECDGIVIVISPNLFKEDIEVVDQVCKHSIDNPAKPVIGYQLTKTRADGMDHGLLDFLHRIPRVYQSEPLCVHSLIFHINQVEAYSSQEISTQNKCQWCLRIVQNCWFNCRIWCKGLHVCGMCDCRKKAYQDTTELTPKMEDGAEDDIEQQ